MASVSTGVQSASGKWLGAAMAFFVGCGFGITGPISQLGVAAGFTIPQLVLMQFLVSAVFLAVVAIAKRKTAMPTKDKLLLVALGLSNAAATSCSFLAIDWLSVSAATAFLFQYVWIAVAIEAIVERKKPGKWTLISALLVIVGALFGSGLVDDILIGELTLSPIGLMFAIMCALFYATFIYFNSRVAVNEDAIGRSFYEGIGCLVFAVGFVIVAGQTQFDVGASLIWGVLMGLIGAALPILALVFASDRLPGGIVAVLTSSELPVAVLAGFLILGESVSPLVIVGVVIILVAIAIGQLDVQEER